LADMSGSGGRRSGSREQMKSIVVW